MKTREIIQCSYCGRRARFGVVATKWNSEWDQGRLCGIRCDDCQTPEQNAEAQINEATLDYSRSYQDAFGRWHSALKAV